MSSEIYTLTCTGVSYDTKQRWQAKIDYANSLGLRGIFIWAIDEDDKSLIDYIALMTFYSVYMYLYDVLSGRSSAAIVTTTR